MTEVSIRDLRNHGGEVVDRAARGEQITITRGGKPVAELRAVSHPPIKGAALLDRWRALPTSIRGRSACSHVTPNQRLMTLAKPVRPGPRATPPRSGARRRGHRRSQSGRPSVSAAVRSTEFQVEQFGKPHEVIRRLYLIGCQEGSLMDRFVR